MIAIIGLEERTGRDVQKDKICRALGRRSGQFIRNPDVTHKPWIARVLGPSLKFGFEREFLQSTKDYKNASSSGRYGIMHFFHLYAGHYYEVNEILSLTKQDRYFVKCCEENNRTSIVRVEREEVVEWLSRFDLSSRSA